MTTITLKNSLGIFQMAINEKYTDDTIRGVFSDVLKDWEILGIRRGDLKKKE